MKSPSIPKIPPKKGEAGLNNFKLEKKEIKEKEKNISDPSSPLSDGLEKQKKSSLNSQMNKISCIQPNITSVKSEKYILQKEKEKKEEYRENVEKFLKLLPQYDFLFADKIVFKSGEKP